MSCTVSMILYLTELKLSYLVWIWLNIYSVICTGWCTYVSAHLLMYQGTWSCGETLHTKGGKKCIGFTVYSNSPILKKMIFVDLQENLQYVNFLCGCDLKSRNMMCLDVPSEIWLFSLRLLSKQWVYFSLSIYIFDTPYCIGIMDCVSNDWLSLARIDCLFSSLCQTRSSTEQEGQPVPQGVRGPTFCPQCTDRGPLLHWPRPVVCQSMSPASVSHQQVVNLYFTWICRFHLENTIFWKIITHLYT